MKVEITQQEQFVLAFINSHDGKGIPSPLPVSVMSLIKKGLVKSDMNLIIESKIRCWLTPLGKKIL